MLESHYFLWGKVRINFFVYISWLQCKVKNMVESWYYWQWRCSGWVFDFNIWFASAKIRPNPYFSKFILMYKSDFHWPVHQSLHPNCTIKSLIVNSISSSNICYHKNDRYGIIDSPVTVTSPSDFAPASSKEFLDIQATVECGFTLNRIRDMTRTYSYVDTSLIKTSFNQINWNQLFLEGFLFIILHI